MEGRLPNNQKNSAILWKAISQIPEIVLLVILIPTLVDMFLSVITRYVLGRAIYWVDVKPNLKWLLSATKKALIALFVPIVIIGGFRFGAFTATEAGAVCAFYAVLVASVFYRNVTLKEMLNIDIETAILTAAVVFLLGMATIYQYIMASLGVPELFLGLFENLSPLASFLVVSFITLLFGLVMEGLPAAVILLPIVFPVIVAKGINPIHFCVVLTLAASIGLFLLPTGAGLLLCLRLTNVKLSAQFMRSYIPYVITIIMAFIIIILFPSLTLILPHSAGIK